MARTEAVEMLAGWFTVLFTFTILNTFALLQAGEVRLFAVIGWRSCLEYTNIILCSPSSETPAHHPITITRTSTV